MTEQIIKCDCTCPGEAYACYRWHTDALGAQQANLCEAHGAELWGRVEPLLKANLASFAIGPPTPVRADRRGPIG